jgi:hypothetical protein
MRYDILSHIKCREEVFSEYCCFWGKVVMSIHINNYLRQKKKHYDNM